MERDAVSSHALAERREYPRGRSSRVGSTLPSLEFRDGFDAGKLVRHEAGIDRRVDPSRAVRHWERACRDRTGRVNRAFLIHPDLGTIAETPILGLFRITLPMLRCTVVLLLLTSFVFSVGCGSSPPADPYGDAATPADFGELKLSQTVNDPRIKGELERLKAQQALPPQVADAYRDRTDAASGELVAKFLRGSDPKYVEDALIDSAHWWNPKSPGRDLLVSTQGQDFLAEWDTQRKAGRNVLLQPKARFPVHLEEGILADPSWTSTMHCLARTELLEAARQASQNNMSEAVTAAAYALAYADQLNQVPFLPARLVSFSTLLAWRSRRAHMARTGQTPRNALCRKA